MSTRSTICRQCPDQPLRSGTAGSEANRNFGAAGDGGPQRDRRSLRERAQNRKGERKRPGQRAARRSEAEPLLLEASRPFQNSPQSAFHNAVLPQAFGTVWSWLMTITEPIAGY